MSEICGCKITLSVEEVKEQLNIRVEKKDRDIGLSIDKICACDIPVEEYEGEYVVIPSIEPQTLPTKEKKMKEDVEVEAIPTYEVSNGYGKTFIIGGKINGV